MKKKTILIIILGIFVLLILAQIGLDLLPFSIYTSEPRTEYGTIVKRDVEWEEWGLEVERGRIIKYKKILLFSTLPESFKHEGLKVKCTYVIADVIDTSRDWAVGINIIDIERVD